jgi:hypothetical protein
MTKSYVLALDRPGTSEKFRTGFLVANGICFYAVYE